MSRTDDRQDRIDDAVSQTLGSLKRLEYIEADPFFFARVQARLTDEPDASEPRLLRWLVANRLSPALLALVVVLNVVTTILVLRGGRESYPSNRDANIEALANQYLSTGSPSALNRSTE